MCAIYYGRTERDERAKNEMTTKFDSADSFIRGYNYGKARKVELTAREIAIQFPDVDVDSFANGTIDGIASDRFRLDLTLGQLRIS